MIVSDAVGVAFFATLLAWNAVSPAGCTEIAVLSALAIASTLAFEILFPAISAKTTPTPFRDLLALLHHEIMLVYVLNLLLTAHVAAHTVVHLPVLEHLGGYVNHACVLLQRNLRDYRRRSERMKFIEEDLGLTSWWSYAAMANLVTFPHNVLRYHVRWIFLRLLHPRGTAPVDATSLGWAAGYVLLFFVAYRPSPLPAWLARVDCRWYQHWHRWFHEDKLLYRAIHKFHHLFKRPGPLASSTETHIEWCMSWAGVHTFCNPLYQINLFMYDAWGAIEMHSHDVLSTMPVIGGADGYHLLHHKEFSTNYSVPDWDRYYGTITRSREFDDYFSHHGAAGGSAVEGRGEAREPRSKTRRAAKSPSRSTPRPARRRAATAAST